MLWEELRVGQFEDAVKRSGGLCIIPVGATEKHGPHLPVGTDTMIAHGVAKAAAELEDAVVFTPFHFGQLLGFQHLPGSICLSTQLIIDYFTELCREIARTGFKKILLLSSHGGNAQILDVISQRTQEEKKDYVVISGNCYHRHPPELLQVLKEQGREAFPYLTDADVAVLESFVAQPMTTGHACFCETLALMGVRPELADLSLMNTESGEPTHRLDHLWAMGLYNPYFWASCFPNHYASSYHPGINERLAKAMHTLNVNHVADLIRAIKQDEELLKVNAEWNQKW